MKHHKGRTGWKLSNVWAWCYLHKKHVRLVKVAMLQWKWLRCPECMVKIF